jgi:hypothetical protein
MAKQFRIKRTYSSIAVVAGGFATIDLPRGYDYESLYIRVNGSVVVSTAATSVRAEAPCQVISRVEVIADGRNTLYSAPMWYAAYGSYDRAGALANGARVTTPPTAATAATYAVEAIGTVDFCNIDGERTKDSNFRTDGLQLFQLRLTFGQAIDMFVAGSGVATFSSMNVEITTTETVELPDAQGVRTSPVALKKVSYQEIAVPTTNANQEVRLPAGNMIKSVVVRTEGGTTAGEPSANSLNNLQVFSGVDVRVNAKSAAVRALNNADYGYILPGYYIADLSRNGNTTSHLSELWDVTQQAEPKISMDITGGTNVKAQVVTTEFLALQ